MREVSRTRNRRPARSQLPNVARVGALTALSTAIALAAHAAAGGGTTHVGSVLPLALLVAMLGSSVRPERAGPIVTLAVLAGTQLAMHLLFELPHHEHPSASPDPVAMLVAHAAAVVVTGLLFTHAEALFERIRLAATAVLPSRPSKPTPDGPVQPPLPRRVRIDRPHTVLLSRSCPRRGPPGLA